MDRSVAARPGSIGRDPKVAAPPNRFTRRLPGPMDRSVFPRPDPLGDRPKAAPREPFHQKASRPADRSVSTLPGPKGGDPKASDPPSLSARRLPGRPDPSARRLPDPMAPDPKTELHEAMVRQNWKIDNEKLRLRRIFLWIISQYFHMLSTSCPKCRISCLNSLSCRAAADTRLRGLAAASGPSPLDDALRRRA